ncbi:MAG TPA: dTMP kinase [Actinomycetota bacterium]|jgi:dTMP kinase|nr:dTMP kinase [Actinomycetota bacterium]
MPSPGQAVQPRFVVLEGLDGAGTTTQAGLLADALRGRDLRVCLTSEPTDGPLGRVLRAHIAGELTLDPRTAALTFTADRSDHLARLVRPALAAGDWVVCDRYLLSTLAYQGLDVAREWVLAASRDFDAPDLTVFLDVPDEALAERIRARGPADRYEAPAFAARLRASYLDSIELLRDAGHRIEEVDGNAEPQAVLEEVLRRLDALG